MSEEKEDQVDFWRIQEEVSFEKVLEKLEVCGLLHYGEDGEEIKGACPLHQGGGKEQNFSINVSSKTFYCSECKETGNVLNFVASFKGISIEAAGFWLMKLLEEREDPQDVETASPAVNVAEQDELRWHIEAAINTLVSGLKAQVEKRDVLVVRFIRELIDLVDDFILQI